MVTRGLADTSVFIAHENRRSIASDALPDELAVSVITIGELRAGVVVARDPAVTARRLKTLEVALGLDPVPIDDAVASAWAGLRVWLRDHHRTMGVNDSWIAATAIDYGLPIVTQDSDFDEIDGLTTIRI